jgi:hypothetical protein
MSTQEQKALIRREVMLLKSFAKADGIYAVRRPRPGIWGSTLIMSDTAVQVAV